MPRFETGQVVRPTRYDGEVSGVIVAFTPNEDGVESADIYEVALGSGSYCPFFACELEEAGEIQTPRELRIRNHYLFS